MDKITNILKIALAILLLLCLVNMPFGYYQLVRYLTMIGFVYLAYKSHEQGLETEMFIFIALAILFQPFLKIALGRQIWNIVDVFVGVGLMVSILFNSRSIQS